MRTLRGIVFYALMFSIGWLIACIGFGLFRLGHELEAVVFLSGSYLIMGFIVGVREGTRPSEEEDDGWNAGAVEGANVYAFPERRA